MAIGNITTKTCISSNGHHPSHFWFSTVSKQFSNMKQQHALRGVYNIYFAFQLGKNLLGKKKIHLHLSSNLNLTADLYSW